MAVERLLDEPVPRARAVPARDPLRAEPDPLAPRVARDLGARPRRDLDLLVLLPRARQGARPVRVLVRPAHAHPLHPGRRRVRGHPRRLGPQGARASWTTWRSASASTRRSSTATRSSSSARRTSASCRRERLLELGVTGPLLRAAGNPWDLRKADPVLARTTHFDFKIPIGTVGDCYDRYRVRVAEIRESCAIIRQAIEGLPEGPYITRTARSRCRRATSSRPRWRR